MASGYRRCTLCLAGGSYDNACDSAQIASNVREFRGERFTVWRCPGCRSLHCLEDIDFNSYYRAYPIQQTRLDFITRVMYRSRLRIIERVGLLRTHRILDYGCGNGAFVEYLREHGYQNAGGYDPYSEHFSDPTRLQPPYNFVLAQDVIEHDPDPVAFVSRLAAMTVRPNGTLVIGTPDAEGIDLGSSLDACGQLHQPFHRHILARHELARLMSANGFEVTKVLRRWYVDTWVPFANSAFIVRFWAALGGVVDASFEPIPSGLFLRHPSLIFHGLLGRLYANQKDVLVVAKSKST